MIQQVTYPTIEQDEKDHAMYQMIIGSYYKTEQLVFVDKHALDRCVSCCPYALSLEVMWEGTIYLFMENSAHFTSPSYY